MECEPQSSDSIGAPTEKHVSVALHIKLDKEYPDTYV